MPKKFQGLNQRSEAARERKSAIEASKRAAEETAKEDALWVDNDKLIRAKQQRKEEASAKLEEKAQKRAELKQLIAVEEAALTTKSKKSAAPKKVTRAELSSRLLAESIAKAKEKELAKKKNESIDPLVENFNRVLLLEEAEAAAEGQELIRATGIDDAVAATSQGADSDLFPEKRRKAAWKSFEEQNIPLLKEEFPTLKLSQLREKLYKRWQKAPENPLNWRQ